jgi:DNA-binding transcriptional LysR family regulator
MNLDRLRTFRALSESLHFRRTAEGLKLSQSAVSQQISGLEADLGVLLVERIGRRVFLTPAGRLLADEATRILAAVDRATESVRSFGGGAVGTVRLGASTTPGVYILPAVLGALRVSLPDVHVAFRIENSAAVERALIENDLDLGIVGEDIKHEELFQIVVAEDVIVAVTAAAANRPRAGRKRVRLADLGGMPLIAREAGSATQSYVDAALTRAGVKHPPSFALPSPEAQVRAAAAGLGVAFVSRHVAANDLAAGRLVELAVEGLRLVRPITAAYHRDKRVTPAMKQLIDLTKKHARPPPTRR